MYAVDRWLSAAYQLSSARLIIAQGAEMPMIKNMAPEVARELVRSQRDILLAWDRQRLEGVHSGVEPITRRRASEAAVVIEELIPHLPLVERESMQLLVSTARVEIERDAE